MHDVAMGSARGIPLYNTAPGAALRDAAPLRDILKGATGAEVREPG